LPMPLPLPMPDSCCFIILFFSMFSCFSKPLLRASREKK
jgi:hypothetical protein